MSNDTKPLVSDEKRNTVTEGARAMGKNAAIIKAQAAELARYRSLAQVLVDAIADINIRRIPAHARDDYRRGYQDALTEIKDPVYSALAKAKEGFDLTPTNQ